MMVWYLDLETGEVLFVGEDTEPEEAERIEAGYGTRYIDVPTAVSHEAYQDMEDFIDTVQDQHFQQRLADVIRGRGAFRRFKDTLFDDLTERERWFQFKHERNRQRMLGWLESEDIELTEA